MATAPDRLRGTHTLLVDDHVDTLEFYRDALTAFGGHVTTVETPADALSMCQTTLPDVVVTDLAFSGVRRDGFWLLEALRKQPALARVPVVAMTGRYLDASWRHQHTFDAVLTKPVDPLQLADLIADLIHRHRQNR